jgi:hypothetical protein
MLLIGGGVIGVILLALGVGLLAWQLFGKRPNSIPQLLAGDTQVYATITPNLSDLPNIQRLRQAFPEALDYQNSGSTSDQLAELLGVDFNTDIAPWIGTEVAAAVANLPLDQALAPNRLSGGNSAELLAQADVLLLLSSRDDKAAQAFLDKQRLHREGQGQQFATSQAKGTTIYAQQGGDPSPIAAFAVLRGNVVFATGPALIAAIAERDPNGADTLAKSANFTQVQAAMPANRLGFIFIDGAPVARAISANSAELLGQLQGPAADRAADQLKSLAGMRGIGLSISVLADGVALDSTVSFDRSKLTPATLAQIEESASPVSPERVSRISADSLAAVSFRIPASFGKQIREALAGLPGSDEQIAAFEKQSGMSLDNDLLSWLPGEASLVLMPGENILGMAAPVTGYFALKPADLAGAKAGIKKIVAALAQQGGEFSLREEAVGGAPWQVYGSEQQVAGGYAFIGDELVIGVGPKAMAAAASPSRPIDGQAAYKAGVAALPTPNAGMVFVNLPAVVELVQRQSDSLTPELAGRLKPFKAIAAAGSPGLDDKGTARARLYFVILAE